MDISVDEKRGGVRFGSRAFIRVIRMSTYCFGDRVIRRSGYENMCEYFQFVSGCISLLCLCD